jgi:fused signal recognition particle receptor
MFGFGKDKKPQSEEKPEAATESSQLAELSHSESSDIGFFGRLKNGLSRTRGRFTEGLQSLVLGEKTIDSNVLDDIETQLLSADVGLEATDQIIENLRQKLDRKQLADGDAFMEALKSELQEILAPCTQPLLIDRGKRPYVILIVGVNGVGKTTTIGKLTKRFQGEGLSVMLAAGDTFRAAAVEQLKVWGDRNQVPVIAQHTGADSASVIFDALQAAKARNVDVLIADSAGRLHTKDNLMNELEKIVRVLKKQDTELPHEVMLVLDATTGQNAINQAESFQAASQVTGISLTKLDGTAKGGVVFALAKKFALPIRFIGVGEQVDDLRPFDAQKFVDALFADDRAG